MNKAEEEFESIGEELADLASERAAQVKCSPEEYRDGLVVIGKAIMFRMKVDMKASEETSNG
jgi:hypothetical protein